MKKLFQIGILILFVIGLCFIQLRFSTPTPVDDDVGTEYADNLNSFDDDFLTVIFETPSQVAAPLKYLVLNEASCISIKAVSAVCVIDSKSYMTYNDYYIANITFTNGFEKQLTNLSKNKQPGKTNRIEGLFRLDIGENIYTTNLIC